MAPTKLLALVLLVAGALALAYGRFTYTKASHDAEVGPIEMSVKEREHVSVPVWVGVAALGAGAIILFMPTTKT